MTDAIDVLYVDGDPEATESTAESLERACDRIDVVTATDAGAGLARLDEDSIDCVVSDYRIPEPDWTEFVRSVREAYPRLPVVLFTGDGSESVAGEAVSLGVADYVRKRDDSDRYARLADRVVDAAEHAVDRGPTGAGVETETGTEWQRTVIRNMEERIYVTDADHVLRFVDYRAGQLDLSEDDWSGRTVSYLAEIGVLSEAEVASIEASADELLDGDVDEIRIELEPALPESAGIVELRMTTMRTADGERLVLGTTRDVTERERRREELERQNERLDEFAGIVSHDLRNPLNVAEGRIQLAREECESEDLTTALDALDRMDAIIEDTLTLARQGETVGEMAPVRLSELATRCWDGVATADATVEVADDATIRGDPDQLRHVFENLFRNSVEHGSPSDRAASGTDGVTVTVGVLAAGDGFFVADDGPGIPDDERDRTFERGYSTADSGTGFGLAIVREIADAHGWGVHATESADGGARFEITGVRFAD